MSGYLFKNVEEAIQFTVFPRNYMPSKIWISAKKIVDACIIMSFKNKVKSTNTIKLLDVQASFMHKYYQKYCFKYILCVKLPKHEPPEPLTMNQLTPDHEPSDSSDNDPPYTIDHMTGPTFYQNDRRLWKYHLPPLQNNVRTTGDTVNGIKFS